MQWKRIPLSADDILSGLDLRLQEAFLIHFAAAGWPQDAILYSTPAHLYRGEHQVFFSPRAAEIVGQSLLGRQLLDCPDPDTRDLSILVKVG